VAKTYFFKFWTTPGDGLSVSVINH